MSEEILGGLLPPGVAFASIGLESERGQAVSRRGAHSAGRDCARLVLGQLGFAEFEVRRGEKGAPVWPAGVVGSITHTRDVAAAVAARSETVGSIGIDIELRGRITDRIARRICRPEERQWVKEDSSTNAGSWTAVIFSAKEAIFKAWYPATGLWLGFQDVTVTFGDDGTSFSLEVHGDKRHDCPWSHVRGRFKISGGHVYTTFIGNTTHDPGSRS